MKRRQLDEEATQKCLNTDSDAVDLLQLTHSERVHMVMHCNEGVDPNGETDAGTNEEEHISINKRISLTEETSKGLEQKHFISEYV